MQTYLDLVRKTLEEGEPRPQQPEEEDLAPKEGLESISAVLPHRHPFRQKKRCR